MIEKHVVVVSRKFTPAAPIKIDVTSRELSLSLPLDQFLEQLVLEIGSPAGMFRTATLLERARAAAEVVTQKMKDETARVM